MAQPEPVEPNPEAGPPEPLEPRTHSRPDWLVGAEEGVQSEYERKSDAPKPAVDLRRPAPPEEASRIGLPLPAPAPAPPPGPADDSSWLVGAEEGVQSEFDRKHEPKTPVDLRRPTAPNEPERIGLALPKPGASPAAEEKKPATPTPWKAAASSVPHLRLVAPTAQVIASAELSQRFPGDPGGAGNDRQPPAGDDILPSAPTAKGAPALAAPPTPKGFDEPWWLVLGERLATDRKLQLLIGGGVALVVLVMLILPHTGNSVGLSNLRRHPDRYEGQVVQVEGRVGEVFAVGGAYAFNLHQGRDTLVVYTRGHAPTSRQHVKVTGSISMGYLDGVPRLALFETGP